MKPQRMAKLVVWLVPVLLLSVAVWPVAAQTPLVDVGQYRENLIKTVDLWNGGLVGESGMGVYQDDFDGFFHINLTRDWQQFPLRSSSSVAQSRAIYMNVEAYRAAGPEDGERFLKAVNDGVDGLMTFFHDDEFGGFLWEVSPAGDIVTDMKQGYGNVHPIFALAQAYSVTENPDHLAAALEQLDTFNQHFLDPDYPGGIRPNFSRDFSQVQGNNNVDVFTHYFEALLALYDVTTGDTQADIAAMIELEGDFLTQQLYHDQDGYDDRGYVAFNYDTAWQPSQVPYTRDGQWWNAMHATTGHNIELAYLLSRAVERGFDPDWLNVADKLIRFCTEYTLDAETGGMLYDITDYDGQPLPGNPDNSLYIWWPQAETARAFLHFTVVRGADYTDRFKAVESLIWDHLTDPDYGGWVHYVDAATLEPINPNKGDMWKVNYHYSMLFAEVLRLAAQYPDQLG